MGCGVRFCLEWGGMAPRSGGWGWRVGSRGLEGEEEEEEKRREERRGKEGKRNCKAKYILIKPTVGTEVSQQ